MSLSSKILRDFSTNQEKHHRTFTVEAQMKLLFEEWTEAYFGTTRESSQKKILYEANSGVSVISSADWQNNHGVKFE